MSHSLTKHGSQVIQERRGIVSKLEIEARMRENKAQAQVVNTINFQGFQCVVRENYKETLFIEESAGEEVENQEG